MKQTRGTRYFVLFLSLIFLGLLIGGCNLSGVPQEQNIDTTNVATNTPGATRTGIGAPTTVAVTPIRLPTRISSFPTRIPSFPTAIQFPGGVSPIPTSTPLPTSIYILSPVPGNVVAGNVQVLGAATHPQFLQYQLEYGPDPNPGNLWFQATGISLTPVINGLLGIWNTTTFQDGTYQLRLRVWLRSGESLFTVVNNIRVQNSAPVINPPTPSIPRPIAAFTQDRTSGEAPLVVRFTNQSTGNITGYVWTFGDGSSSTEANPVKTFTAPGRYLVTLTANGPGGSSNVSREILVNTAAAPVANFDATPTSGNPPLTVTFNNTSTGNITSYLWTFGSGTPATSTDRNPPPRTFTQSGTYNIILQVTGPGGSSQVTKTITVNQPNTPAPDAIFTANPTSGELPLTVTFDNNSTNATSYVWDFGVPNDTTDVSTDAEPTFVYNNPGTYTVILTAIGAGGQDTATTTITVTNPPDAPVADFDANPTTGTASLTVTFNNTSTGDITAYEWDFGDNSPFVTTEDASHTYTTPGTYNVILKVAGPGGQTQATAQITVTTPVVPPNASFTANPESGTAPRTVQFTSTSTGDNLTFAWNFGDSGSASNTSTDPNPTHEYQQPGTYTVSLTVTNSAGNSSTTRQLTFTAQPEPPTNFTFAPASPNVTTDQTAGGATVGTLSATGSAPLTYTLTNAGGEDFSVSGTNVITTADVPAGNYNLTARVTDANNLTADTSFTVRIDDAPVVNEPPTNFTFTAVSPNVTEDQTAGGATVGTLSATDTGTLTYTLTDDDGQAFDVSGANVVTTGTVAVGTYNLAAEVTDEGGLSTPTTFQVTIDPAPVVNQPPTNFTFVPSTPNITEDQTAAGATVGSLSATDTGTLTYTLTNTAGQPFAVSGANVVTTGNVPAGPYSLEATVTDEGGLTATTPVNVTIDPAPVVNQPPTNFTFTSAGAISEDQTQAGSVTVGTLSATDTGTLTYALPGNAGGLFALNGTEVVTVGTVPASGSPYSLEATVTDEEGLSTPTTFTVTIDAAANGAPTNFALSNTNVDWGTSAVGSTVGTFSATDSDTLTFALVNDAGAFALQGADLIIDAELTQPSYTIRASVSDGTNPAVEQDFTINVTYPSAPSGQYVYVENGNVYVGNFDGSPSQQITTSGAASNPVWSSNNQIAFIDNGDVYVVNADGSPVANITTPETESNPAWSADGTQLAYESGGSIYTATLSVTTLTPSPTPLVAGSDPVWQPGGNRIAFVGALEDSNNTDIYVVNVSDGTTTRFTIEPGPDTSPAWSSNGQIAFVSARAGDADIFVMSDSDPNAEETNLTVSSTDNDTNPGWSSNGAQIVFVRSGANAGIYVMNADGTGVTRISSSTAQTISPSWRP